MAHTDGIIHCWSPVFGWESLRLRSLVSLKTKRRAQARLLRGLSQPVVWGGEDLKELSHPASGGRSMSDEEKRIVRRTSPPWVKGPKFEWWVDEDGYERLACLWPSTDHTVQIKEKRPRRGKKRTGKVNPDEECRKQVRLSRQARTVCRFLARHCGLKRVNPLPSRILCGQLRSAIRSTYPTSLPVLEELTIKTAMKIETRPCKVCESGQSDKVSEWEEARLRPQIVDSDHLQKFRKAFALNVDQGWNRGIYPFVPNGHATLSNRRCEGGNWLREPFSDCTRPVLVWSSGKPRIVTLYSEFNTRTLAPLHHSLYDTLKRKGWLLVGSPTDERVSSLNGREWVSVDYSAATDNIKTAYTRAAVEVLKQKAEGLTKEEAECMDVLGSLTLAGHRADSGQPMGSVMSFPLLCLINKTVVDLGLTDLLDVGEISFKEWTSHRCLINGDDLLFREPGRSLTLLSRIRVHGSYIGLVLNEEKTMVDAELGEINSTLFRAGVKQKKTNVASLFMREVSDVLGFAAESTCSIAAFKYVVLRSVDKLADQDIKLFGPLPKGLFSSIVRSPRIRAAIQHQPIARREQAPNPFPVVVKPADYDLPRESEVAAICRERDRLRDLGYVPPYLERKPRSGIGTKVPLMKVLKRKIPSREDNILKVCAREWESKRWDAMIKADPCEVGGDWSLPPSDLSGCNRLLDNIKLWKQSRARTEKERPTCEELSGFVALDDAGSDTYAWTKESTDDTV